MRYLWMLALIVFVSTAKAQNISKPSIEFTRTGIYHINKVSFTDTATIVDVSVTFLPNQWNIFSSKAYLENAETGEKYTVKNIQGAKLMRNCGYPSLGTLQ